VRPVLGGSGGALLAVVMATMLWAAPASAETTLAVDAGYAGAFVTGQEVPVRVRVSADRLVRGTLEVGIGNPENSVPVALPVEVPGGSQKEFLVTAPSGMNQSPDVVVRLLQGDQVVAAGQSSIRSNADTELVGILPGALRGRPVPGQTALAADTGTARFAALGAAELEQAPASLGPLSTLVADVDELGRLSPGARAGVLRWLEGGGRLLVDAAKGQTVPGLPDAWQPGTRGRAAAGVGEVVATEGAVAAGRWSGLVEPSGRAVTPARFGGDLPLSATLAADAGLRTPQIAWLVRFLIVYVVAVGPVLFFAVRRRGRPELAWVAVPLVALLFSSGSWAVGRNLRKATELVHASIVSTGAGGPVATSYIGVFSRSGGTSRIGFPAGWSSGSFVQAGGAATPTLVAQTGNGPEARLPLDTGQFGLVHANGPAADAGEGGLEISAAEQAGGQVAGEVRNRTAFRLDEVAVFVGSDATLVGDLAPGETRAFTVNLGQARTDGGNPEFRLWGGFGGKVPGTDVGSVTDFGLWQVALQNAGVNFLSHGAAVVAGWTRDYEPAVRVGSRTARPEGRTVVLGRQELRPPARGATPVAARRDIVRDPFGNRFIGGARGGGSVLRFVLPEGADTANLVFSNMFGSGEVWQDGAWKPAQCAGPGCQPIDFPNRGCPPGANCVQPVPLLPGFGPNSQLAVPAASVINGVVYVRVPGPATVEQPVALSLGRTT
jgi:hypothetical protein